MLGVGVAWLADTPRHHGRIVLLLQVVAGSATQPTAHTDVLSCSVVTALFWVTFATQADGEPGQHVASTMNGADCMWELSTAAGESPAVGDGQAGGSAASATHLCHRESSGWLPVLMRMRVRVPGSSSEVSRRARHLPLGLRLEGQVIHSRGSRSALLTGTPLSTNPGCRGSASLAAAGTLTRVRSTTCGASSSSATAARQQPAQQITRWECVPVCTHLPAGM